VRFDPRAIVAAFERQRTSYVLVGGLARVLQGADGHLASTHPFLKEANLERVQAALDSLEAQARDRRKTPIAERVARGEEVIGYRTPVGDLQIVPTPAGTQGYDDLRRRANREYLGEGIRADVASINDL
jgi:hypothetical protein